MIEDLSKPQDMEHFWDEISKQGSSPEPVTEQDVLSANKELNSRIETSKHNIQLYNRNV